MKHVLVASMLVLALGLAGLAPKAGAVVVLDQIFDDPPGSRAGLSRADFSFRRAQTFTVGIAGILDHVDLGLEFITGSGSLNILATSGGVPTTTVLATTTVVSTDGPWTSFDLLAAGLSISVGDILAIETIGSASFWLGTGGYVGGADHFLNPGFGVPDFTPLARDNFFRTFVDTAAVPEPSTLMLMGIGLVGLGWMGRKKPRR